MKITLLTSHPSAAAHAPVIQPMVAHAKTTQSKWTGTKGTSGSKAGAAPKKEQAPAAARHLHSAHGAWASHAAPHGARAGAHALKHHAVHAPSR